MKTTAALFAACLLAVGIGSCSDDDGMSVSERCEQVCQVDANHACYKKFNTQGQRFSEECVNRCKAVANDAERNFMPNCGHCVADTFKYSIDPSAPCNGTATGAADCCWGVQHEKAQDKTCALKCFEPDGGMPNVY